MLELAGNASKESESEENHTATPAADALFGEVRSLDT